MQYGSFEKAKLTELANKIVLDEIHSTMRSNNFSRKIIDATYVGDVTDNDGTVDIEIVSDYESEGGFSVSEAREEGTRDHKIEPANTKSLSWIQNGKRFFSKGHWVRGIRAEKIIERTIKKKTNQLNREWTNVQDRFFEETVNGSS